MENKKIIKTDLEWKKILTPSQFAILRGKATESCGINENLAKGKKGKFYCVACNNLLFNSKDKFDSGTGWPSFTKPATKTSVEYKEDNSFGMKRTEVLCWRCRGHLGHVFNDSPIPAKRRFCINGEILKFVEEK